MGEPWIYRGTVIWLISSFQETDSSGSRSNEETYICCLDTFLPDRCNLSVCLCARA
uniref:Uncharacterized protein n=1 Tax=Rhizophora mucronata TaxID=61149 RepID=A0A2P2P4T9_RHIMU